MEKSRVHLLVSLATVFFLSCGNTSENAPESSKSSIGVELDSVSYQFGALENEYCWAVKTKICAGFNTYEILECSTNEKITLFEHGTEIALVERGDSTVVFQAEDSIIVRHGYDKGGILINQSYYVGSYLIPFTKSESIYISKYYLNDTPNSDETYTLLFVSGIGPVALYHEQMFLLNTIDSMSVRGSNSSKQMIGKILRHIDSQLNKGH